MYIYIHIYTSLRLGTSILKNDEWEYSHDLFLLPTFIKCRHFYYGASMLINQHIVCVNIRTYYQSFIYSLTDALVSYLKNNNKICIKIDIRTAPTCFGVTVHVNFNVNFDIVFKTTH